MALLFTPLYRLYPSPNHPYTKYSEFTTHIVAHFKYSLDWQKKGELLEIGLDCNLNSKINYDFFDTLGITKPWSDWLRYNEINNNYTTRYATIAGNRDPGYNPSFADNDGIVLVDQVHMDNAEFNAVIYASHSNGDSVVNPVITELGLPSCTFTKEFIENWMIDDNSSRYGSSISGKSYGYDANGTYNTWDKGALRIRSCVTDYSKSLVVLVRLIKDYMKKDTIGDSTRSVQKVLAIKAFPIYKYSRGFPGDPVFLTSKTVVGTVGLSQILLDIVDMDETGEISHTTYPLHIVGNAEDSSYVSLSHVYGCYIGHHTNISWATNDYAVYQKLYYKKDNGSWVFFDSLNGNIRNYTFTPPSTGDYQVKIEYYLDAFTPITSV